MYIYIYIYIYIYQQDYGNYGNLICLVTGNTRYINEMTRSKSKYTSISLFNYYVTT